MKSLLFIIITALAASCNSQEKKDITETERAVEVKSDLQIAEYVTGTFEDSKGNLWFGTLQKGIARYDGSELKYFTSADGLPSDRVTGIIEDSHGMFWLKTGEGMSMYDGERFSTFRVGDNNNSNVIANLLIDSKNVFWVGTWNGVYTFDGADFHPFSIPYPEVDTKINDDTKFWITGIQEDAEGNIWFERDGYGVCKYDGESFTHLLKKDGLPSNNVTEIEFDNDGSMWIGTRVAEKDNNDPNNRTGKGGVNRMVGTEILSFPDIKGFNDADVYDIHKDGSGNIWISTTHNGVYRYDGSAFKNYKIPISIMCMSHDKKGNLWLGGAGGLYSISPDGDIVNVTQNGPWK
jgi:ligand-binding sensor domain-containing protein